MRAGERSDPEAGDVAAISRGQDLPRGGARAARGGLVLALVLAISLGGVAGAQVGSSGREPSPYQGARTVRPDPSSRPPVGPPVRPNAFAPAPAAHRSRPSLLVRVLGPMPATARPGGGRVVGSVPATSRYYHVPLVAWVIRTADHGRFGLVSLPYRGARQAGWIPLDGLPRSRTPIEVRIDLSRHELVVERLGRVILRAPAATGAAGSPTPPGRYFVTDRVPFPAGSPYGTFAFGLSGIQTHLPPGWTGGDQLAIHGTNDPGSIGTSASAGCVRVAETVLARLRPLLRLGTPVVIRP